MCLRRGQYKNHIRRWFLQCLKQGIKGSRRKHMHLIDDIHLIITLCRTIGHFLTDLTDIIHAIVGCGIDLDHIHGSSCLDCSAHLTFVAGTSIDRMLTVHCLRQNLRHRCLTGTSRPAEQIGMSDTAGIDLICQRCHNVILPFDISKIIRSELSVQGSITHK